MTAEAPPLCTARLNFQLFGVSLVEYSCACGFETGKYATPRDEEAKAVMAAHLADEHGDELHVGRCAGCGRPTDHFRMATPFGDVYGCEAHSPAMRDQP